MVRDKWKALLRVKVHCEDSIVVDAKEENLALEFTFQEQKKHGLEMKWNSG